MFLHATGSDKIHGFVDHPTKNISDFGILDLETFYSIFPKVDAAHFDNVYKNNMEYYNFKNLNYEL